MSVANTKKQKRRTKADASGAGSVLKKKKKREETTAKMLATKARNKAQKIAEEQQAIYDESKEPELEDHPKYYERELHEGTHMEIIAQLCEVFPYLIESDSIPTDWFYKKVKGRFSYASKDSGTFCYFFDNPWEAQALHNDWIKPKLEAAEKAMVAKKKKAEDKKAALKAKMTAKGL